MAASKLLPIVYGEFWLIPDSDGRIDTSNLSICGMCSAVVTDEAKHTAAHSCGCSAEFRIKYGDHAHDPADCPLAEDCGWGWNGPCGGCDRCIIAQVAYGEMRANKDPDTCPVSRNVLRDVVTVLRNAPGGHGALIDDLGEILQAGQ